MSAPVISRPATRRRSRARLRPVPFVAGDTPLTVTISIDGGGKADRERVFAAVRELVSAAGADAAIAVREPAVPGEPAAQGTGEPGADVVRGASAGVVGGGGAGVVGGGGAGVVGGGGAGVVGGSGAGVVGGSGAGVARGSGAEEPDGSVLVDPRPRAAFRDGKLLDLSRLEYDLLLFFARHPRQVFTRTQLLARVWGHVHAGARTVDVHISRLRAKLDDPDLITTVYGVGYRLADNAAVRLAAA